MRLIRAVSALTLLGSLLSAPAIGQNRSRMLRGVVWDIREIEERVDEDHVLTGANVHISGWGSNVESNTDPHGEFYISLPAGLKTGTEITLLCKKVGYAVVYPAELTLFVPDDLTRSYRIRMLPKGHPKLLSAKSLEQHIDLVKRESARQAPESKGDKPDPNAHFLALSQQTGVPVEQVEQAIKEWIKESRKDFTNLRRQALADFAEKNFRGAADKYRRIAEERVRRNAAQDRESAADFESAGDASYNLPDYRQAVEDYQSSLDRMKKYKDDLGAVKLKVEPGYASDLRRITSNSANAKIGLGQQIAGPESRGYFEEAVRNFQQLSAEVPRSADPQDWARNQYNLGIALRNLGECQDGEEGARRLAEAVEAYHRALTVRTRDEFPKDWADTQYNLGIALRSLGECQDGEEGARRLAEAVEAIRMSLTFYTRDKIPKDWADTQFNLGNALRSLGACQGGEEGARRLAEAVEAYRLALTFYTRDKIQQDWADTQNNLGIALQIQIGLGGFPKGLEQVDRLLQAEDMRNDPVTQASLRTLAIVCQVAADQSAEASRTFEGLVALVGRQPDDFRLVWDWTTLRKLLAESDVPALAARRGSLNTLIDAVGRDNKAAILAGLKDVQDAFKVPAEATEKPPGK